MFARHSYQAQIVQEDLKRKIQKHDSIPSFQNSNKSKKKAGKVSSTSKSIWVKIKGHLKLFLKTSSIHGLNHLVAAGREFFEIIFWLHVIILSVFGCVYLSYITWMRYQSSPTVISMDRDMFAWNTTFPSVTICPHSIDNIDKEKLNIYLNNSKEVDKIKLEKFIKALANATFSTFENIPEYSDVTPDRYVELLLNLSLPFDPLITMDSRSPSDITTVLIITEMGLCYSVNSGTAVYNSPKYRSENRWDIINSDNETLFVHPLDGEVFAKITMRRPSSFNIYIHGPQEMPDITSKFHVLPENCYINIDVTAVAVYTSADAATLSVSQRRCRYPHENYLKHNSIYTYTMCRIECRIRLCLKYCQCIPHFYRRIGDEKICNVEGLHCLAQHEDELYRLMDKDGKRIDCGCLPMCDDVNYVFYPSGVFKSVFPATDLKWGIKTYPRVRYKRDIIFSFTDVLVAVGGMAGLFLGCCVLSFMEIVYFFTLRLMCYKYGRNRSN